MKDVVTYLPIATVNEEEGEVETQKDNNNPKRIIGEVIMVVFLILSLFGSLVPVSYYAFTHELESPERLNRDMLCVFSLLYLIVVITFMIVYIMDIRYFKKHSQ